MIFFRDGFFDFVSPKKNSLRCFLVHDFIQTLQILAYVMQCVHKAVRVLKLKWFFREDGGEELAGQGGYVSGRPMDAGRARDVLQMSRSFRRSSASVLNCCWIGACRCCEFQ
jgi:hypothetical protein